jgi:hypothetical protein
MATVIDGSASVTINSGAVLGITSGTAVASTSGTSIDFTGIPSWVKRLTVMLNGVSTNGASAPMVQIGSGSVTTSGYLGAIMSGAEVINFTTGFYVNSNTFISSGLLYGNLVITLLGSNAYTASGATGRSDIARAFAIGGSVTLSGALDRVRITTTSGTDTFDAGTINIMYEG